MMLLILDGLATVTAAFVAGYHIGFGLTETGLIWAVACGAWLLNLILDVRRLEWRL